MRSNTLVHAHRSPAQAQAGDARVQRMERVLSRLWRAAV